MDQHLVTTTSALNCPVGAFVMAHGLATATSTAWPAAKLVLYIPVTIHKSFTVKKVGWMNGTTPSGNIDFGIYNEAGTRLYRTGSTAAGTSVQIQTVTPTAFTLPGPARYYFAVTCDGTPYTLLYTTSVVPAGACASLGIMSETTGSFGLTDPWGSVALTSTEFYTELMITDGTVL